MKPINKYILITPIEEELKTSGGMLLSDEDAKGFRYKKGEVVKEGTTVTTIKEGDKIFYDRHAGFSMMINEKPYTVIKENDVVVVL